MDFLWSVFGFALSIGILVTIHEWGHFQVARLFNVKVLEFSIGFGKALYQRPYGETLYKIAWLPLGGYVRFVDEREGEVGPEDLPRAFNRQSVYKRIAIVAAGPLINLLLAWLLFSFIYVWGISSLKPILAEPAPQTPLAVQLAQQAPNLFTDATLQWELVAIEGQSVRGWGEAQQALLFALLAQKKQVDIQLQTLQTKQSQTLQDVSIAGLDINRPEDNWLMQLGLAQAAPRIPAVIGHIAPDGPAAMAGLIEGDRILALNGFEVEDWAHLVACVQARPGETVQVTYERNQAQWQTEIILSAVMQNERTIGQMGLGVLSDRATMAPLSNILRYGPLEAVAQGWNRLIELSALSLEMLQKMLFGEVSLSHLSGPISIAQMSGQAVQSGLVSFLGLLALLSLSIGILNLLPIPILDGGHLLYYFVEILKGSPLSDRVLLFGQSVGLFIVISFTLLAVFNDILRISNG